MDKQKVVVVLLVIAIVMSVISVVVSVGVSSSIKGFSFPVSKNTITTISSTNTGPDVAGVGITILKPGSGK